MVNGESKSYNQKSYKMTFYFHVLLEFWNYMQFDMCVTIPLDVTCWIFIILNTAMENKNKTFTNV